jgi:hypothetical protein
LAGRVLLKIVYLLMRWLFGLTVLVFRGDEARDLSCWRSGTRMQYCAVTQAGCGTGQPTGPGNWRFSAARPRTGFRWPPW